RASRGSRTCPSRGRPSQAGGTRAQAGDGSRPSSPSTRAREDFAAHAPSGADRPPEGGALCRSRTGGRRPVSGQFGATPAMLNNAAAAADRDRIVSLRSRLARCDDEWLPRVSSIAAAHLNALHRYRRPIMASVLGHALTIETVPGAQL